MAESFRKDFYTSLKTAKKIGVDGIQAYCHADDSDAVIRANITKNEIQEIKNFMNGEGLEFSAICGDFGCKMYYMPEKCRDLIDREKKVLELAKELGTNIVTTHIGAVPEVKNCMQYESMHDVCKELADFADSINGHFAVETGPEKSALLKSFLDDLESKGVGVNLDPANLVMCAGDVPQLAVKNLKDYIVHTHAKDGIMVNHADTKQLYAAYYYGMPRLEGEFYRELPLGTGGVNWNEYVKALKEIGYNGYLTIERECGDTPENDISLAYNFLKSKI